MALAHAILSLLSDRPASGYDITKQFDSSVGFFWKATHQQVYRELAKLEAQGWVESDTIAQTGRPDKKLYRATTTGLQALRDWIAEPTETAPLKEDLLVKLYAGAIAPTPVLIQEVQRHRRFYGDRLATYRHIESTYFAQPDQLPHADALRYLTLRRGLRHAQSWIDWCDEAIALLQLQISHSGANRAE
ncbi:PadR family transcriptional regulator [Leptolyngbya sp. AN02str]|uniref:PadR family transcriptional regulator n=1 Tax=Leptolyngbya sp. AN02str TaxID=3423363 RepID=UPI003D31A9ED